MRKITPKKMHGEVMAKEMPEPHYPTFSIDLEHLPEAKDWKIGKTYDVRLQLKMTAMSQGKGMMGNHVGFDIVGIHPGEEVKGKPSRYEDTDNK